MEQHQAGGRGVTMRGPRVVVALDYATVDEARRFVAQVSPAQCRLKVGLELYASCGPDFVRELVQAGFGVFLDLKFHDIPNTVEQACRQAARLGVELLTVHCLGGPAMLAAARRGAGDGGRPEERSNIGVPRAQTKVLGVTLLTSLSNEDALAVGLRQDVASGALALAELAQLAGLDGVVCAPTEAEAMRRRFGADFLLVTPGVRPAGAPAQDQRRVMTPREAMASGADLLVIGRPITRAENPRAALDRIREEIAGD
jgi:orotidine-5'-phosphate decarboxylase